MKTRAWGIQMLGFVVILGGLLLIANQLAQAVAPAPAPFEYQTDMMPVGRLDADGTFVEDPLVCSGEPFHVLIDVVSHVRERRTLAEVMWSIASYPDGFPIVRNREGDALLFWVETSLDEINSVFPWQAPDMPPLPPGEYIYQHGARALDPGTTTSSFAAQFTVINCS